MTERWQAEAEQVARDVHEAMQFQDEQGAVDAILELIERVHPQWAPIETAPKQHDGMLLSDGVRVSQGGWLSQVDQGADYEGQAGAPSAGWWSVDCIEATHWMPLPAPPGAGAASPSGERQEKDGRCLD